MTPPCLACACAGCRFLRGCHDCCAFLLSLRLHSLCAALLPSLTPLVCRPGERAAEQARAPVSAAGTSRPAAAWRRRPTRIPPNVPSSLPYSFLPLLWLVQTSPPSPEKILLCTATRSIAPRCCSFRPSVFYAVPFCRARTCICSPYAWCRSDCC